MKFTHKNIDITVNDRAQFVATVQGARVVKPSLDAMKKHIDDMLAKAFVPFKAMLESTYGHEKEKADNDGFVPVNVIGLDKSVTSWRRGKLDFVVEYSDTKRTNISSVMVDTPENRKAAIAVRKHSEETKRIEKQRDEELKALRAKVVKRESEDEQS